MIKRSGVEVMNARTKNVSVAKETIEILKQKCYISANGKMVDIEASLDAAIKGTVLYQQPMPIKDYVQCSVTLEVTNETTAHAAVRLASKDNLVALNFASARNQGGGFLGGAVAQEEDLCRCSGLYACIKSKPIFYNENILCEDAFYTDNVIYSPKVPFFRDEHLKFLEEPFTLSVISAPAPNVHAMESVDTELLYTTLFYRATKVLQIAEAQGHKNIILGAWGCGAFGNDSKMVAQIFLDALALVPTFEYVCFAVYDTRPEQPIYNTFKRIFMKI